MLKFLHLGIVSSLIFAFAQSPFQHTHDSDPDHAHARGFSHAHWEAEDHDPVGPILEDVDHDSASRLQEWLAGDGTAFSKFVPDLPVSICRHVLVVQASIIAEVSPHNHDPPSRLCLHPRAPPA